MAVLDQRTADQIYAQILRWTPQALRNLEPYLRGIAKGLEIAEDHGRSLLREALVSQAAGIWLDLHGACQDAPRAAGEDDDTYRARLVALPSLITPLAIRGAVGDISGLAEVKDSCTLLERWQTRIFCNRGASPEYVTDAYCGEANILSHAQHAFVIVLPDWLDDAVYEAVAAYLETARPAGVRASILIDPDGLAFVYGKPWETP